MRISSPGRPKDPFSAALDALRLQLRGGRLILGEPLTITDLAEDLGLSATPVREALSRLAGEGLIEDRRGRGYFARRVDVADLVELYALRSLYLVGASRRLAQDRPDRQPWAQVMLAATEHEGASGRSGLSDRLFGHLVALAGSQALLDAYHLVAVRLAPAVRVEADVLPDVSQDAQRLAAAFDQDERAAVSAITEFHKVRQDHAGDLVRAMRASANISAL